MKYAAISIMAFGGRLATEASSLDRLPKEAIKFSIHWGEKRLKEFLAQMEEANQGNTQFYEITTAAQICGLERVTHFFLAIDGIPLPCYYMEGGNLSRFCKMTGIYQFPDEIGGTKSAELVQFARQYGTVIYENADVRQ